MRGTTDVSPSSSSLFAFKPRQVLLLEQQNRSLELSAPMANTRPENPAQLTPENESILASSVALWLEKKGYSKVLKRFLSAAQIQDDTWKAKALNLNDIFSKYQESCSALDQVKSLKKQEEQADGTKETNGDANGKATEQIGTKIKKKKGKGDATVGETGQTFEVTAINENMNESKNDLSHKDEKSKASKKSKDDEVFEFKADQVTKKPKDKKMKKKKSKLNSESLGAEEVLDTEITKDKKSKKRSAEAAENVVDESKKASKKRKRMPADENEKQSAEEAAVEESKSKKSKGLEEGKDAGANGHASELNNEGAINNDGVDKSSKQKSAKRQGNISAEQKTLTAFQRVKVDEVEFVDERLQDNSYWAKGGAEIGYGAKAQEVLGQVRGRDFRHEKTKKKRGSYRGGQIDLQSHSVKFNYSDDE
ncbi:hypothetical protein CASFOL_029514 [Castilleja foliolosa]|uniref:Srp40 C-terminal domain-containing protein n=1 Tax=Castilleja foliolosa TaxID=1961234 RepID=A0ABD3C834_9LAMI